MRVGGKREGVGVGGEEEVGDGEQFENLEVQDCNNMGQTQ